MIIRQNPWRYNAPPGWNNIQDAPRDGTVIELQNNYGVAPSFSISKWEEGRGWRSATSETSGTIDGPHLSWRPYNGDAAEYVDPTGGAQNTRNYWLQACGYPPAPGGDLDWAEEIRREQEPAEEGQLYDQYGNRVSGEVRIAPGESVVMSAYASRFAQPKRSWLRRLFG